MTIHDLPQNATVGDVIRLNKLYTYFDYFEVEKKRGLSFKLFVGRVDAGVWEVQAA